MAIHATSADALLSYSLATSPTDPLNASTDKDPVTGRLDITVGRTMTTAAYCKKIIVKIPIGAGAAELTTVNNDDIKQSVTGGTLPEQGNGWSATAVAEGNKRVFTFTPGRAPQFTGQWAVTLVISQIPINKVVGKPVIEVIEETSPTNGNFTPKDPVRITVDKAPPGFLFRNLRPSRIMVANGDPVTLTWEIQNGTCVMYWDDQSDPDVNTEPKWTSPKLHNTTGFMLQATSAEDASFIHTLTTAVTVDKPDLEVGHLNVYGKAHAHDDLTVDGSATAQNLHVRDKLVVSGAVHALDVLQASGKGIIVGTSLSKGPLEVHGKTIAHDGLEVEGSAVVKGGLDVRGSAKVMGGNAVHQLVVPLNVARTMRFASDGMIFGDAEGNYGFQFTVRRSAGSYTLSVAKNTSFCFPMPQDAEVVATPVPLMGGSGPYPSKTFFFVPFGIGGLA
ncbi:hypothetical protein [Kitasatospora sp. NBC_01266]|uniref:hypothetical protein n=1 Tax=Kitasatospora sp. NBC_01266 TaxID=2903572 RepID=UPI002E31CDED|nr:hypothetical protein [Kitasatospora sp. NBC_01266]